MIQIYLAVAEREKIKHIFMSSVMYFWFVEKSCNKDCITVHLDTFNGDANIAPCLSLLNISPSLSLSHFLDAFEAYVEISDSFKTCFFLLNTEVLYAWAYQEFNDVFPP